MKTSPKYAAVKKEVKQAYKESTPNFNFLASATVTIDEAVNIMVEALEGNNENVSGYNEFMPSHFRRLPEGTKITLAREGSVCAYVQPPKGIAMHETKLRRSMRIDEWDDQENGTVRLWWD